MRRLFLSVLLLALAPSVVRAQSFPFEVYSLKEGLPQSQVTCLIQDKEGYVWVGTWGGLARYNGDRFTNYYLRDGLPSGRVQELLIDPSGLMWVATTAGLAVWRDHQLVKVADPAVTAVRCRALTSDRNNHIWTGTDKGLFVRERDSFASVTDELQQAVGIVYGLLADGEGVLAVTARGLFSAAAGRPAEKLPGPPVADGSLRCLLRTAAGLWVGTSENGLFLKNAANWTSLPSSLLPAKNIYRLAIGGTGVFYVASQDAGLFRQEGGQGPFEALSARNGLPSNVVNCVLEDNQGNVWVGTDIGGLARLRSIAVTNYTQADGLPNSCVFNMWPAAKKGEMWFATLGGGARCRVEGGFQVLETIGIRDGLSGSRVWKIVVTPSGEEWVLTDNAYHYRRPGQRRFERLPPNLSVPDQELYNLSLDNRGRVWLAGTGREGSVAVRDLDGRWRSWNRSNEGQAIKHCNALALRRAGGMWIAAGDRILQSDGLTVREMPERPPLPPGAEIIALYEDMKGRLWAGNDGGLAVRETGGRWRLLSSEPGYASTQVYFIGEDPQATIWVGTTNGILRFAPSGRIEMFGLEEGLAGMETNQDGFYAAPDGSVWIATVGGASRVDLKRLKSPTVFPPLIVEAADLPGRSVKFPKALKLSTRERTVTFRVAVLAYGPRHNAFYRARLDGMETDWLLANKGGELRYTNLTGGSLRLLLQAVRDQKGWGKVVSIPIEVNQPFWSSWWFRLTGILLGGGFVLGLFYWRTYLLRQRAKDLETIVAKRTNELMRANEELERLATHDPLTGLWNQRVILDRLSAAIRSPRNKKSESRFGLIIVDLDDFKQVNDRLGHMTGDIALRDVALLITSQMRQEDYVGRYGGDEFLIVLAEADRAAIESVVKRIAELSYTARNGNLEVTVTASCGAVVISGEKAQSEVAVLALADSLLYQAKKAGKHGYIISSTETPSPRPS